MKYRILTNGKYFKVQYGLLFYKDCRTDSGHKVLFNNYESAIEYVKYRTAKWQIVGNNFKQLRK